MIRHICMFKLKEENRSEILKTAVEKAEILRDIPQIRHFEVVVNTVAAPESNYELSLIFDFDNMEELNAYQADERHVKFGNYIKSVREARACIDYEFQPKSVK